MIHTATGSQNVDQGHQLSHPGTIQFRVGDFRRSGPWQARMQGIAERARKIRVSLFGARIWWGTPAFFEFERRAPVHRRLGPGLSRDSDSLWALSEWQM